MGGPNDPFSSSLAHSRPKTHSKKRWPGRLRHFLERPFPIISILYAVLPQCSIFSPCKCARAWGGDSFLRHSQCPPTPTSPRSQLQLFLIAGVFLRKRKAGGKAHFQLKRKPRTFPLSPPQCLSCFSAAAGVSPIYNGRRGRRRQEKGGERSKKNPGKHCEVLLLWRCGVGTHGRTPHPSSTLFSPSSYTVSPSLPLL